MSARAPSLAVCIPVYNRVEYVEDTVRSALAQPRVQEIAISDNGSTDGTVEVLERLAAESPRVTLLRQPENRGADRNYLECVRIASKDYCWLLGSDDWLDDGAADAVAPMLEKGVDVVLVDRVHMSRDMKTRVAIDHYLDAPDQQVFECGREEEFLAYLRSVRTIAGAFSFISAIVIRKAAWDAQPVRRAFMGSAWIHVTKVLDMLRAGGRLGYVRTPVVLSRLDNDSFGAAGIARRRRLDLDYVRIARECLEDHPAAREALIRVVERQFFTFRQVLSDTRYALDEGAEAIAVLREGYRQFEGRPGYLWKMGISRSTPPGVLRAAHRVVRATRAFRGNPPCN